MAIVTERSEIIEGGQTGVETEETASADPPASPVSSVAASEKSPLRQRLSALTKEANKS